MGVAFLTLLERNFLGFTQIRVSPNKSSFSGILQAVYDGVKLLSKISLKPFNNFNLYFFFTPILIFSILFLEWLVIPFFFNFIRFINRILIFLSLVGFLVYLILFSGLFSVSKYSLLGSLRRRSQRISFELVFFFFTFIYINQLKSFAFFRNWAFLFNLFIVFLIFLLVLVELGRAPFDFPESESELVRGYNTEFRRILFVLIFLREYGFIIIFGVLIRALFFNFRLLTQFIFISLILIIRSVYPRRKYDYLMGFFWYVLLPLVIWVLFMRYLIF